MGTILASVLIGRAQTVTLDTGAARWASNEWLDWLNVGQREIAAIVPHANRVTGNLTLVAGTKQALPAGALFLHGLTRNMGVGGATPGEAPRQTSKQLLDLQYPTWQAASATTTVKNWAYDPSNPSVYWVYPPMSGATAVEAVYSATPTDVAAAGNAINVDDKFANALLDYMLYRAFSKDTEIPGASERAALHRASFENSLDLMTKAMSTTEAAA